MVMYSHKKCNVLLAWVIALATLAVALMASLGTAFYYLNKRAKNLENIFASSLYLFSDSVDKMELNLSKLKVSSSPRQDLVYLLDIYNYARKSEGELARLPIDSYNAELVALKLNQIGDWAKVYNERLAGGENIRSESDIEQNYKVARLLSERIGGFTSKLSEGYRISAHISPSVPRGEQLIIVEHKKGELVEKEDACYKGLENLPMISAAEAKDKIIKTFDELKFTSLDLISFTNDEALTYEFSGKTDSGQDVFFVVSVAGGVILEMSRNRQLDKPVLKLESAEVNAQEGAKKLGFDVSPVWGYVTGSVAYVNLAPIKDGIIYYPDLVKAKIALDNGELLGIEASGYCLNHCVRNVKNTINEKTARAMVSDKLDIEFARLAVIPTPTGEVLTYEVSGEADGNKYLVYVDAFDGAQVKILRVFAERTA